MHNNNNQNNPIINEAQEMLLIISKKQKRWTLHSIPTYRFHNVIYINVIIFFYGR